MALVFIGLGSNIGSGRDNIQQAWRLLGRQENILALGLSSPYLTEPVGMISDHWFTNAVGALETRLTAADLLDTMLNIEKEMGRDRGRGMDRPIDLDILYYDDDIINEPTLTIPHPEIAGRLFVLAPLAEIAPDHIHPVTQLSSSAMKRQLITSFQVKKSSWQD